MSKRFNVLDTRTEENVLGGAVGEDNAYIAIYPSVIGDGQALKDLQIGESSLCEYRLSGSRGIYRVVRIDDDTGAA